MTKSDGKLNLERREKKISQEEVSFATFSLNRGLGRNCLRMAPTANHNNFVMVFEVLFGILMVLVFYKSSFNF